MPAPLKIGIRDSGVGGLTVARRVREAVRGTDLLVFADTAHVPYGEKTPDQIRHYALSISEFLIEQGAQIVVFACNTTSALALEAARQRFEVPIYGVIEPGARAAAQSSAKSGGKIGVLATAATVVSGVYTREIRVCNPALEVREIACPALVPLVEAGEISSDATFAAGEKYLAPLLEFGADTVVLGCTHYPLLLSTLQTLAPQIRFIDPAQTIAQDIAARFGSLKNRVPVNRFWVSGAPGNFAQWAAQLLQIEAPHLETGPIFDL